MDNVVSNVIVAGTKIPVDPLFFLDTMRNRLRKLDNPRILIRGSGTHCEALIKRLAQRESIPVVEFAMDYKGPYIERAVSRDTHMGKSADYAFIWWDGFSKDIQALINLCKAFGVKTKVYYLEVPDAPVQHQ